MRVLIVEDDAALGTYLQKGLKLEGHQVEVAGDGWSGLQHCLEHRPDLMVLDLSLPQMDGLQVLEHLQGRLTGTSVLVLTGRNGLEERVKCLNLGADDCLLKPFSLRELMARCGALVRRREQFTDPLLRLGGVELDRMRRTVVRDGQAVDLTTKEFALLEYLMRARGRVCSRAELLREVWQMTPEAGTNVVDVYVNYLRKKLAMARACASDAMAGAQPLTADHVIETMRGEGYAMAVVPRKKPVAREMFDDMRGGTVDHRRELARA